MNAYTMHAKYINNLLLFVNIQILIIFSNVPPDGMPKQVWLGKWDKKINM